jgi:hypothetical protein
MKATTFCKRLAGACLLVLATVVPIGIQYLTVNGPTWLSTEAGGRPPLAGTGLCLMVLLAGAGLWGVASHE